MSLLRKGERDRSWDLTSCFAHFSIANREHLTTVFGEANTFSYKKIGTVKIDVL